MRSPIGLFSVLILALCAACGSSPEPAPEPSAEPAAAEGPRPTDHGCGQCAVVICHNAEQPRRLERIQIKLDRIEKEGAAAVSRLWKDATLELVPAGGTAESVKLDVSKWAPTGPVAATVRNPALRPAKTSWQGAKATLTAQWKGGGKVTGTKFELPVTVEACK